MTIEIRDLSKRYKGGVTALAGLTLTVPAGMFGLLGANGAGKTTLMRVLAGIVRPTGGTVRVGPHDPTTAAGRRAVQRDLGYLPQDLGLYPDLSARSFLDYVGILKGLDDAPARRRRVGEVLDLVALGDVGRRRVGGFSGGMKRRLGIAQALLGDPGLLIVDEPTAGLDPEERLRFRNLLAGLGAERTVLLSTHIVDDIASSCRRLAVLARGRLVHAGDVTGVVDAARGRVWQVRLPPGVKPEGDLTVVSSLHQGDHVLYRVVANSTYPIDGTPLAPTLEDGYLALMSEAGAGAAARPGG